MGMVVLDAATLCVRINERARNMLGYPDNEFQLNAIDELVRENYREQELPLFYRTPRRTPRHV